MTPTVSSSEKRASSPNNQTIHLETFGRSPLETFQSLLTLQLDQACGQERESPACLSLRRRGAGDPHQRCLAVAIQHSFTRRVRARLAFQRRLPARCDNALADAEDRARAAAERLRRRCIAPVRSAGIEREQDVRMLDLLGRRPAFADHLRQRQPFRCREPYRLFDQRESLLITSLKQYSYDHGYA